MPMIIITHNHTSDTSHGMICKDVLLCRPFQVDMPMIVITLAEVAEALIYLHASGFIHCDLKPENILLKVAPVSSQDARFMVMDVAQAVSRSVLPPIPCLPCNSNHTCTCLSAGTNACWL
jgi:hypothetical protein